MALAIKQTLYVWRWTLGLFGTCAGLLFGLLIANAAVDGREFWPADTASWRCEPEQADKLMREPQNALSNVVFVFVGIYALFCVAWDRRFGAASDWFDADPVEPITRVPATVQTLFGLSAIFGGYASFYYHACGGDCSQGGFLDLVSIFILVPTYIYVGASCLMSVTGTLRPDARFANPRTVSLVTFVAWCLTIAMAFEYEAVFIDGIGFADVQAMKFLMVGAFAFLLLVWVAVLVKGRQLQPNFGVLWFALGSFSAVVAVLSWFPEEIEARCVDLDEAFQLHAMWHVMVALALLFPYLHVRTVASSHVRAIGAIGVVLLKDPRRPAALRVDAKQLAALQP